MIEKRQITRAHAAQIARGQMVAHTVPGALTLGQQIVITIGIGFGFHQPKLFAGDIGVGNFRHGVPLVRQVKMDMPHVA